MTQSNMERLKKISIKKEYRRLAVFLLLLVSVFACVESPEVRKKKMEDTQRLGIEYLNRGKYTDALKTLLEAEKIYPEDAFLQNTLGYTYMAKEQYDLAIKHYKKALQIRPNYSEAKNNLGVAYIYKKEWDNAIPYFEEITKDLLYGTPHRPLVNLGSVYYNKKNYALSEQYYLKALKLRPNYDDALYGLGRTYLAMGKIPEAVSRIEAAVRISSNRPRFYFDLASAYAKSGDFKKALKAYKEVIELVPGTPLAFEASKELEKIEKKK